MSDLNPLLPSFLRSSVMPTVFACAPSKPQSATATAPTLSLTASSLNTSSPKPVATPASPWKKMLIGGTVTVFFEAFGGGHFLEFLKISKQTSSLPYSTIVRNVTATKGIAATLDGFLPWGFVQSLAKGAVFSFGQALTLKVCDGNKVMSPWWTLVFSGGMGGFFQGVVMSPILLLKTRVMTDPAFREIQGGLVGTAVASAQVGTRLVRQEGLTALMKGSLVFSCKRFADWTTRFFFVAVVEDLVRDSPDQKLDGAVRVACSLAGGTLSALVTIPIDVMVATIQQASKAGSNVSVIETFRTQLAEGGLSGTVQFATRGLVARVAHVALTTAVMKTAVNQIYDAMYR